MIFPTPDRDVEAFRAAWVQAARVTPSEIPNPVAQRALDRLAEGVARRVRQGATEEVALRPFSAAIKSRKNATPDESDSLMACVLRDADRVLVNVSIGYASTIQAFDRSGKRLRMPTGFRWYYGQTGRFLPAEKAILFDGYCFTLQGMEVDYRVPFLRRTKQGYALTAVAKGVWNLDPPHPYLGIRGGRVNLWSIDELKQLHPHSAGPLVPRKLEIWTVSKGVVRRTTVRRFDQDVRLADAWLSRHPRRDIPKFLGDVMSLRRGPDSLELKMDESHLLFRFSRRNGKLAVRSVHVLP